MVSRLAEDDVSDLERDEGVRLTFREVVRLNAVGLRVTNGQKVPPDAAPRFFAVGNVTLREPTLQVIAWHDNVLPRLTSDPTETFRLTAFALAHAEVPGFFRDLVSPEVVRAAYAEWEAGVTATEAELAAGVSWCLTGGDPSFGENPPETGKPDESDTSEECIRSALAARLGLPVAELLLQTPTRLRAAILRVRIADGGRTERVENFAAEADYVRTLNEIRRNHGLEER